MGVPVQVMGPSASGLSVGMRYAAAVTASIGMSTVMMGPPCFRAHGDVAFRQDADRGTAQRGVDDLGQMDRLATGAGLLDLGTAGEAVGDHERGDRGGAYGGKQNLLPHGEGHVPVIGSHAEVPGQAAAARREFLVVEAGAVHEFGVGVVTEHGVMVAMRLADRSRPVAGGGGQPREVDVVVVD